MPRPRLHKSSFVVLALGAMTAILVEVPGRVVREMPWAQQTTEFQHGWPWVYLRRESDFLKPNVAFLKNLPRWSIPWLSAKNWEFWHATHKEHPSVNLWNLVADFFAALLIVAALGAAWEWRRRRRPSMWSFRTADLLAAVAIVSGVMAWLNHYRREFEREELVIEESFIGSSWDEICVAPDWMQSLMGPRLIPEYFWRDTRVRIRVEDFDLDKQFDEIATLQYIRSVDVVGRENDHFPFSKLRAIKHLTFLDIMGYGTDGGHDTKIDETDLRELAQLQSLQKLAFGYEDGNPPTMLSRLKSELPNCKITDCVD
jgi:hypothetical protein